MRKYCLQSGSFNGLSLFVMSLVKASIYTFFCVQAATITKSTYCWKTLQTFYNF